MNENGRKRREWVKTAAIVFLSIMLVLTFFSNTIMNYSLPEVATQYVQSGSITAKIRGTGVVESGDPYNVMVTESRKVSGVAVRVGDVVKKGDVLMYLEDTVSDEMQGALAALQTAQAAYDTALMNPQITAAIIKAAESDTTAEDYRKQITSYQNAVTAAQNNVKPLEEQVASIQEMISNFEQQLILESSYDSVAAQRLATAQTAKENAERVLAVHEQELQDAAAELTAAQANLEAAKAAGAAAEEIEKLTQAVNTAAEKQTAAQTNVKNATAQVNGAVENYNSAAQEVSQRETSQAHANLNAWKAQHEIELYNVQKELAAAQAEVTKKQTALDELVAKITNIMNIRNYINAVKTAQEKVNELNEQTTGSTITAPIAGTITSLGVAAGETTSAAMPVAVMQPEGQGYTLSFTVTNEQARRLSVGDKADLINAWRYDDVIVTLKSIRPDQSNPGQQKVLTFTVEGNVVAGQTLNLSVGQKSANYDYIVPNSAIREDNNGQFILIVESKASPLGTRYMATRVDVQVVASDDTQSAITGGVYGYEFVITTSTKPVEAGKQVRLAD